MKIVLMKGAYIMRLLSRIRNSIFNRGKSQSDNINEYLRNAEKELGKAKAEISAVMEETLRLKREFDECNEESEKLQKYIDKAVADGYDNDAGQYLERKNVLDKKILMLKEAYDVASADMERLRDVHDRLVSDLESINEKKAEIKSELRQ
ncbi:MAG: PspA/IM30 family protein [Lachnospiraceae bacterium]|nr:PspA/IM30 family protein [Lachnospiraceae bacterium]